MQLERARMRLRLLLPAREARKVREKIASLMVAIEQEDWTPDLEIVRMLTFLFFSSFQITKTVSYIPLEGVSN